MALPTSTKEVGARFFRTLTTAAGTNVLLDPIPGKKYVIEGLAWSGTAAGTNLLNIFTTTGSLQLTTMGRMGGVGEVFAVGLPSDGISYSDGGSQRLSVWGRIVHEDYQIAVNDVPGGTNPLA